MTVETHFTKGPWAVSKRKPRKVTAGGVVICNAVLRNQGGPKHKAFMKDEHEAEANASLIGAAPELYEALDAVMRSFFPHATPNEYEELAKARAALAKARGEA